MLSVVECREEKIVIENGLTRLVNALPGLMRTPPPDGRIGFLNRRGSEFAGLGFPGSLWLGAADRDLSALQESISRNTP